jgi:hypothetical protein
MATTKEETLSTASRELEDVINQAIKKVNGKNENSLCRYLPMKEGYMHHFTLRKMMHHEPQQLAKMIKTYIVDTSRPSTVPPKQRAARGSRKKNKDQIVLTKADIDRILQMARAVGDKEVVRKLVPKKDLRILKRELISAIRQNKVDQDLWLNYSEAVAQLGLAQ